MLTIFTERSLLAGMFTRQPDVARPAFEVARNVITSRFRGHVLRAFLLAVLTIITIRALLVASFSHPAAFAEAFATDGIAR